MMHAPAPHPAEGAPLVHLHKKSAGPVQIAAVWPRTHKRKARPVPGNPLGEPPVLACVFFGRKVAAAAPGFIPHTPVTNVERVAVAARSSHVGQRGGARRRVAILDPFIEITRGETANVRGEIRFRADEPAKPDELIRAE